METSYYTRKYELALSGFRFSSLPLAFSPIRFFSSRENPTPEASASLPDTSAQD